MYCPNCGNKNAEDQSFCRSCGLGLEKIALSLTEQLPTVAVQSLQERKEKLERLGVASLSVFGLGIFGFLLYSIFSKLLLSQGLLVAVLAVLGAIIFLGSGLASVILFAKAKELKEAAGKRQLEPSSASADTCKLLETRQQPFSITDRTTNLLPVDAKKK
jgi:hypothetical protein